MAMGNVKLMHKCFLKHLRMGTARMKKAKETEERWQIRLNMERSKVGTQEKSPTGLTIARAYRPHRVYSP